MIKSILKRALNKAGYTVLKNNWTVFEPGSMPAGMQRAKDLGISPSVIIDIGAAQGSWTQKTFKIWPEAVYHLIEPLKEQIDKLEQLKKLYPKVNYHLAVAGETSGKTYLNISPDLDGSGVYGTLSENAREVPVIMIDDIVRGIPGEILIKFDTHGYEVPILQGAKEALERTSLLIIEVYGFKISPTCLLFHELSVYLDTLGFRLADIVDVVRRPGDQVFWQADAFYLRKDNPVFEKNSYA
jgi:FkbM family methyltransferase